MKNLLCKIFGHKWEWLRALPKTHPSESEWEQRYERECGRCGHVEYARDIFSIVPPRSKSLHPEPNEGLP